GEEVDLRAERPAPHVLVEVRQVGVGVVGLEERLEPILPAKEGRQLRLPGADVPGDGDELLPRHASGPLAWQRWGERRSRRRWAWSCAHARSRGRRRSPGGT